MAEFFIGMAVGAAALVAAVIAFIAISLRNLHLFCSTKGKTPCRPLNKS